MRRSATIPKTTLNGTIASAPVTSDAIANRLVEAAGGLAPPGTSGTGASGPGTTVYSVKPSSFR